MPIKGRNKKARALDVYRAYKEAGGYPQPHPKPSTDETFKNFQTRMEGSNDIILEMLIKLGYGEPSRRAYLQRLSEVRDVLHRLDAELCSKKWPKE